MMLCPNATTFFAFHRDARVGRQNGFSFAHEYFPLCAALVFWFVPTVARAGAALKAFDTPYYTIYTDLDEDGEREAAIRMTKMAEEYHDRTKDFSGVIREKLPFYLYRSPQDYYAAGGMPGSAGVFIYAGAQSKLMAIAGQRVTTNTWHTVQHEGFHQFAHAVIGGEFPSWLNEGLAEYFGEGIFTGDGFVIGVVPPWRLKRLKQSISSGKLKPIRQMMLMSPAQWRNSLSIENYDQAWSMVHFLVHGDGGKYQSGLAACIREISGGKPFEKAWLDTLGPADGFEARWKAYWMAQPASPTADLYARATVSILTSFLARATAEKQSFDSFDEFIAASSAGKLKMNDADWLPPSLLSSGVQWASDDGHWSLRPGSPNPLPTLFVKMSDGAKLTGSFVLNEGRVQRIEVTAREP